MIKLLICTLLLLVVVGRTVTVLGGGTNVDVCGNVVVGKTVAVLVGVKALLVLMLEGLVIEEVNVVVKVFVLVLVLVEVLGKVVKKLVEKDSFAVEVEKALVKVNPLSLLESNDSNEDFDGEKREGDLGEQDGSLGHEEGSLGSQVEEMPLNQLRSLTGGGGSSSYGCVSPSYSSSPSRFPERLLISCSFTALKN